MNIQSLNNLNSIISSDIKSYNYLNEISASVIATINNQREIISNLCSDFYDNIYTPTITGITENNNILTSKLNNIKQYNTNISANHYPYLTNAINYNKGLLKLLSTYYKIPEQFNYSNSGEVPYKKHIMYKINRYKNLLLYANRNLSTQLGIELFLNLSTYTLINNAASTIIKRACEKINNKNYDTIDDTKINSMRAQLSSRLSGYNMYNDNNTWFHWWGSEQGFQDLTKQNSGIYGFPSASTPSSVKQGYNVNSGALLHEVGTFVANLNAEYQYFTVYDNNDDNNDDHNEKYSFTKFALTTTTDESNKKYKDIYQNIKYTNDIKASLECENPTNKYIGNNILDSVTGTYNNVFNLRATLTTYINNRHIDLNTYQNTLSTELNTAKDLITTRLSGCYENYILPISGHIYNTYITIPQIQDMIYNENPWRISCKSVAIAYLNSFPPPSTIEGNEKIGGYNQQFEQKKSNRFFDI